VDSTAGRDLLEKIQILCPYQDSNPGPSSKYPSHQASSTEERRVQNVLLREFYGHIPPALPCPARPVTQMTPWCGSHSCVAGPTAGIPETRVLATVRSVSAHCTLVHTATWGTGFGGDCLTASTGQKPSREANSSSASQINSLYLWNAKFHYRVQNSPPIVLS
jgi:hypothetical protein